MSPLLRVLANPEAARNLKSTEWELLLSEAGRTRMTGRVAHLLYAAEISGIPVAALDMFESSRVRDNRARVACLTDLRNLSDLPQAINAPVILVKGCAFIASSMPVGEGRRLSDIDILIPNAAIDAAEDHLTNSGWAFSETLNEYDERYYRDWAHELPPMRNPDNHYELDVHHALIQPTNRFAFDPQSLFDQAVPIAGTPFYRLSDEDLIIHTLCHLLISDEARGGLSDLYDIRVLFDTSSKNDKHFPARLSERADELGLTGPMKLGLALSNDLLGSDSTGNGQKASGITARLLRRALTSPTPNRLADRITTRLLLMRAHWLRMPMHMLIPHLISKATRPKVEATEA